MGRVLRKEDSPSLLDKKIVRLTEDGKRIFPGDDLFKLKATHGLPLDFALDKIINEFGMAVSWVEFIEEARRCGWWDFQTFDEIDHSMADAMIPREMQTAIKQRFRMYVVTNKHPSMPEA